MKELIKKEVKLINKEATPAPSAAPGPTSYEPKYDKTERTGPKGFSFGKPKSEKSKDPTDERLMLYPSIDAVRPNYRQSKTVMKKPIATPKAEFNAE